MNQERFSYALSAEEGAPLPDSEETYHFTLNGNQDKEIIDLRFVETGVYEYKLELLEDGKESAYYESGPTIYFIEIYVVQLNGDLKTFIIIKNPDGTKAPELHFTHKYVGETDKTSQTKNTIPTSDSTGDVGSTGESMKPSYLADFFLGLFAVCIFIRYLENKGPKKH